MICSCSRAWILACCSSVPAVLFSSERVGEGEGRTVGEHLAKTRHDLPGMARRATFIGSGSLALNHRAECPGR